MSELVLLMPTLSYLAREGLGPRNVNTEGQELEWTKQLLAWVGQGLYLA